MSKLLRKLWAEDDGAVITTEFLLIVAVLFFGLIPAFVGYRNLLAASLLAVGDLIWTIISQTTFDGYQVQGIVNPLDIASTPGYLPPATQEALVLNSAAQQGGTATTIGPGALIPTAWPTPAP